MSRPLTRAKRKAQRKTCVHPVSQDPPTQLNDSPYRLLDTSDMPQVPHHPGTLKLPLALCDRALFILPHQRTLTQQSNLPVQKGCMGVGYALDDAPACSLTIAGQMFDFTDDHGGAQDVWDDDWGIEQDAIDEACQDHVHKISKKAHYRTRQATQFLWWQTEVIPSLIDLYLDICCCTHRGQWSLEAAAAAAIDPLPSCTCGSVVTLCVTVINWDSQYLHHQTTCIVEH
jgi:hypothetical protein